MTAGRPLSFVAVLFVYVIPVLAVAGLLAASGLGVLALVLVAGEVLMSAIVVVVRRRPARDRSAPSRRPWIVPLVMAALLAAMVGLAFVAERSG